MLDAVYAPTLFLVLLLALWMLASAPVPRRIRDLCFGAMLALGVLSLAVEFAASSALPQHFV